jgi:hypothetical protein
MYVRTTSRRNKDGSVAAYYQLAENYRDENGVVRTRIIYNFGRADSLDLASLERLCGSIARVCGFQVTGSGHDRQPRLALPGDPLPEDVRQKRSRAFGTVLAISTLWERLGIRRALEQAASKDHCSVPYERAVLAMTANRLCTAPTSKLGVWGRWLDDVYLPDCSGLELAQMYEAMDLLHRHAAEVEEAVFFQTADLLNLEVDLVFYDTTTASFSIDEADDDGPRLFGHSKEGTWTPQVVVALAVTRRGLPVRSWVFPGNTADSTTVERVRADLRGWKLGRALFVADSGMNSADNRRELARACGRYLLASRDGSVKEVDEEVLGRAGRYKELAPNLWAKEVVVGEGEMRRRYILCRNPDQAKREALHREQVLVELGEELASHPDRDATAKWAAELRASGRYGRYLKVDGQGRLVVDAAAVRKAERHDGKWVIETNDDTLSIEDAAAGYKAALVIEQCFRSLKRTQIQMTPMYHWLPRRIEAHVKICILALLIQRVAEIATERPWAQIRRELDHLQVTEFETNSYRFFRTNDLAPEVASILEKLKIKPPSRILGTEKLAKKS